MSTTRRYDTATELACDAVESAYDDLIRESLGGLRVGHHWPTVVWGCNDPGELRDVHRWLVEHGEKVARHAAAVLSRALDLEADEEFSRD